MAPIRLPKLNHSRDGANPFMRFFSPPEVVPAWGPIVPWTQELDLNALIDHSGSTEPSNDLASASLSTSLSQNEDDVVYWDSNIMGPVPDYGDSVKIVDVAVLPSETPERAPTLDSAFDFSAWWGPSAVLSNEDGEVLPTVTAPPAPFLHAPASGTSNFTSMPGFSSGASSSFSTGLSNPDGVSLPTHTIPCVSWASNFTFENISPATTPASSAITPSNPDWTVAQPQCVVDAEVAVLPVITVPTVPAVSSLPLFENFSPGSTPALSSSSTPSDSSSVSPYQQQNLLSILGQIIPKRPRKDSAPPKPRNAFILFRCYQTQQLARDNEIKKSKGIRVEKTHQTNFSKIARDRWRALAPKQSKVWYDLAEEEKRLHTIAYPDYKYPASKNAKGGKDRRQRKGAAAARGTHDAVVVHQESPLLDPMVHGQSSYAPCVGTGYNMDPSFDQTKYLTRMPMPMPMPIYGSFGTYQEF